MRKDGDGTLTAICLPGSSVLKGKTYRRHARRGLAEGMLGRGVIVCEGVTEKDALLATAEKMEESDPDGFYPLDLSGVSIISKDGDGSMPEFGAFFKALHVQVFALYDAKKRKVEDEQKFKQNFNIPCQAAYSLSGHPKTGQRWSGQNRPTEEAGDSVVLPRGFLRRQVYFRAPTSRTAFENMTVMEEAIEHGGDGCAVPQQFSPVVHGSL